MSLRSSAASICDQALAVARRPCSARGRRPFPWRSASPPSLVAGVAMAKSGMGVPLILMTLLVYAGSAQIAACCDRGRRADVVVWATTLCVSLRPWPCSSLLAVLRAPVAAPAHVKPSFVMGDTSCAVHPPLSRAAGPPVRVTSWAARWSPSVFG